MALVKVSKELLERIEKNINNTYHQQVLKAQALPPNFEKELVDSVLTPENIEYINKAPAQFFMESSTFKMVCHTHVIYHSLPQRMRLPAAAVNSSYQITDPEFVAIVEARDKAVAAVREERSALYNKVRALLTACGSVNKFLKLAPDFAHFIPLDVREKVDRKTSKTEKQLKEEELAAKAAELSQHTNIVVQSILQGE